MGSAIKLRDDFGGGELRVLARKSKHAGQSRRLLSLAAVYDGGTRSEAARLAGVTLQIVRDWVLRFNAEGPEGLIDRKAPGARSKLNAAQRAALAAKVEAGPIPAVDAVVRWRRCDLAQWIWEEFAISLDESSVGRELRKLGFVKLSARPRHYAQDPQAAERFKKTSPLPSARSETASRPIGRSRSGGRTRPGSARRTS